MQVTVEYCGQLRQLTGRESDTVLREDPVDIHGLLAELAARYTDDFRGMVLDGNGRARASLLVAVNGSAVDRKSPSLLADGDVVTLLPPIGGG